jgi:hypothetical protein
MSLFDKLFSAKAKTKQLVSDEPAINFGRYSDINKTSSQLADWEKSINFYKGKKYLDAYEKFFLYLKDKTIDNVFFRRKNNRIEFEFIQGSKIIKGSVNDQEIYAEAEVVRFEELSSPVMAKLLQENYKLYFSKFVIKNNIYSIKYYSPVVDASPESLYYALKELAIKADIFDDELLNEFYTVKAINTKHIKDIPEEEKRIKIKYFKLWLNDTLDKVSVPDEDLKIEEISYILLNFLYAIHYLISPEGVLLDDILNMESVLLKKKNLSGKEKNKQIIEKLIKINEKTNDVLLASLYKADATFAVNSITSFKQIKQFIDAELIKLKTKLNNNNTEKALEICKYIFSYSSFTFGMPDIATDLLQIVWRIFYPTYFKELGFKNEYYSIEKNDFDINLIKTKINILLQDAKIQYPGLKFNTENLQFNNQLQFTISFFNEFKELKIKATSNNNLTNKV